ncbi:MAG: hypothetical protein V4526_00290 [Patescibacteria group bacterium]
MIEIATTIGFLMTSLTAGGNMQATAAQAIGNSPVTIEPFGKATTVEMSLTDTTKGARNAESFVREAYKDTPLLIEIARCESTFTHSTKEGKLLRGRVDDADVGVMQINERYHSERAKKMGIDLHTIEGNMAYAKYLYETQGAQPWSASSKCWGKTTTGSQFASQVHGPKTN